MLVVLEIIFLEQSHISYMGIQTVTVLFVPLEYSSWETTQKDLLIVILNDHGFNI